MGSVVNSFAEMEAAYSEHYQIICGKRSRFVGPFALTLADAGGDLAVRGDSHPASSANRARCPSWLNTQAKKSAASGVRLLRQLEQIHRRAATGDGARVGGCGLPLPMGGERGRRRGMDAAGAGAASGGEWVGDAQLGPSGRRAGPRSHRRLRDALRVEFVARGRGRRPTHGDVTWSPSV